MLIICGSLLKVCEAYSFYKVCLRRNIHSDMFHYNFIFSCIRILKLTSQYRWQPRTHVRSRRGETEKQHWPHESSVPSCVRPAFTLILSARAAYVVCSCERYRDHFASPSLLHIYTHVSVAVRGSVRSLQLLAGSRDAS